MLEKRASPRLNIRHVNPAVSLFTQLTHHFSATEKPGYPLLRLLWVPVQKFLGKFSRLLEVVDTSSN